MTAIIGYTGRVFLTGTHAFLGACTLIVDTLFWLAVAPLRGKGLRVRAAIERPNLLCVPTGPTRRAHRICAPADSASI